MTVPFQGLYSASKHALEAYTESLRMEVRAFGIEVTIVEPGDFATGFTSSRRVVGELTQGAYAQTFSASLKAMERDEQGASPPDPVAAVIAKAIATSRPRPRYPVGQFAQTFGVAVRPFFPDRWYEAIIRKMYDID